MDYLYFLNGITIQSRRAVSKPTIVHGEEDARDVQGLADRISIERMLRRKEISLQRGKFNITRDIKLRSI